MMKIPNVYEGELTFNLEEVFSTGFWKKKSQKCSLHAQDPGIRDSIYRIFAGS